MHYYQHHIGDFTKDTANLNDHQLATYMRMLWDYYSDEKPLTDDCESIAFAVRSDEKTVLLLLKHYFILTNDGWRHSRCDREIEEYKSKADKARNSANARWRNANALPTQSERNANELVLDANQEPITKKNKSTSSAAPSDLVAERLATVTGEAVSAYNASSLTKSSGGNLPNVSTSIGREKRQGQVRRCLRVARQICEEKTGSQRVTPEFWGAYFDLVAQDDFYSGRTQGGQGHQNYVPDFELLTREDTMLRIYDKLVGTA